MSLQPPTNEAASFRLDYFVDGVYLGRGSRSFQYFHNQPVAPESRAFFCQFCGEVWARVVCEEWALFQVYSMTCRKCRPKYQYLHPWGSIWMDWDRDWNDAMPAQVLVRELLLHIDHWKERNA